ncbi:hypothetical protein [Rhodoplanes azumiensis]|uniref:Uncharacterized protein n=1 Tax=Rhodoplanes azumiensis TaxID=1897628 RepID=A0ABW5ANK9_9BRAD
MIVAGVAVPMVQPAVDQIADVIAVHVVKTAVVQIVDRAVVLDGAPAAAVAVPGRRMLAKIHGPAAVSASLTASVSTSLTAVPPQSWRRVRAG